jgi:8-oxo-dGTP pyrophosphatase MutT (NUDIX family)
MALEMTTEHRNPPTVVVVMVPVNRNGLLLIRRGIPPGVSKIAIPGGYQNEGETWQQAGAREVAEETGIEVTGLRLIDFLTVEGGRTNLAFAVSDPVEIAPDHVFKPNPEVQEVIIATEPCDTSFPTHTDKVWAYFAGSSIFDCVSED